MEDTGGTTRPDGLICHEALLVEINGEAVVD